MADKSKSVRVVESLSNDPPIHVTQDELEYLLKMDAVAIFVRHSRSHALSHLSRFAEDVEKAEREAAQVAENAEQDTTLTAAQDTARRDPPQAGAR